MRPPHDRRRATALVITVGLLAVLAIIGFGFAVLARLQQQTAQVYSAAADVELLSHAGTMYGLRDIRYGWTRARAANDVTSGLMTIDTAVASMGVGAAYDPVDSPASTWYVNPSIVTGFFRHDNFTPSIATDDSDRYCMSKCNSYSLVHDVLGNEVAVSFVAVLDSAGKVNVNDRSARTDNLLNNLINVLEVNTLVDVKDSNDNDIDDLTGSLIVNYRNALPNSQFTSLHQLKSITGATGKPAMTQRRFDVLKNYLTIYSWPHDPPSVDPFNPVAIIPDHATASYPSLTSSTTALRSPININTAPYQVLVAVLKDIQDHNGTYVVSDKWAAEIAKWICRKRDPENKELWTNWVDNLTDFSDDWKAWTSVSADYKTKVRKHDCYSWRSYPLGPFDSWDEFIDFIYALTDDTSDDPFPTATVDGNSLTQGQAEAIIAAVCPNSFATITPRTSWQMGWSRLNKNLTTGQALREKDTATANVIPEIIGKNDLNVAGYNTEFCFSSRGRFEINSRTFAFVKADFGKVTSATVTSLTAANQNKAWGTAPPQWRGFSVLIYDGKGKGQLRTIVNNSAESLAVGCWSTDLKVYPATTSPAPADWSRFYILGPGPLVDRVAGTPDPANRHFFDDNGAAWEEDQWNGYRVVLYQCDTNGDNIDEGSIQERVILDTQVIGNHKRLLLSPEVKTNLSSSSKAAWGYMILGSNGSATHEAAVKAYDVIYHNSQKDFVPNEAGTFPTGCTNVAIGPNALADEVQQGAGIASIPPSKIDGWLTVAKEYVDKTQTPFPGKTPSFLLNFEKSDLAPTYGLLQDVAGEDDTPAATLAKDIFDKGRLFSDGLHLRYASGHWLAYSTTPGLVIENDPGAGKLPADGGFLSLWYRPDFDAMSGSAHTILRIRGKADQGKNSDLRLILKGTTLKLVVRADGKQPYNAKVLHDKNGNVLTKVTCQESSAEGWDGPSIDVRASDPKWQVGEWHHIAIAWYEAVPDPAKLADDDTTAASDMECDADPLPTGTTDVLDQDQVIAKLRLWVDAKPATQPANPVQAFNLVPDGEATIYPCLQIGESGSAPCGTVDGVIAFALDLNEYNGLTDANIKKTDQIWRYKKTVGLADATYTSPTISTVYSTSKKVCLGTVAWTGFYPWCDKNTQDWGSTKAHYPIRVSVGLGGTWSEEIPKNSQDKQPVLGGGGPIRDTTAAPAGPKAISGTGTVQYKVYFDDFVGETAKGVPQYWQTPLLDDITITVLGPVVFYNWR